MNPIPTLSRLAAVALCLSVCHAAYLIEIDTDGTNHLSTDPNPITYNTDFSFGGGTTSAGVGVSAPSSATGMNGGNSIFGGDGSPHTYVYTYSPDAQTDNLFLAPNTPLGNGDTATGATGGAPGRYAIYAAWPATYNVSGGLTNYGIVTAGDSTSVSIDQNGGVVAPDTFGNVWVKVGEVEYTSGPITVTQTPNTSTYVSMRAAGLLFELISETGEDGYEGPPGPVVFGQGTQKFFGLAFERDTTLAETHHHAVLRSTDLENWTTTDLKLFSVTDVDAATELVTFHSMTPMAGQPREFLKVEARLKLPANAPYYVAITYDDGPHQTDEPGKLDTNDLLDILAAKNIRATFYVVGNRVPWYPHIIRRMINEGHEIGNHSLTHTNLTTLSDEDVIWELASCRDAIVAAATVAPTTMRPPGGNRTPQLETLWLNEFGYPTVIWNVDPEDWKTPESGWPDPVSDQEVIDRVIDGVAAWFGTNQDPVPAPPAYGPIILLHDIHHRTISVTPTILDSLLAQGYSFVTVSELLEMKGP